METNYETKTKLLSLLGSRKDKSADEAVSFLDQMIGFNEDLTSSNAEQARRIVDNILLFAVGKTYIQEHKDNWYAKLYSEVHPTKTHTRKTTRRIGFDGQRIKTETDSEGKTTIYQKDSKGEYLPVDSKKNQGRDTSWLLERIAEGDTEAIEREGFKVKKAKRAGEDNS